ncbi:MAG: response regulator transcription factor [Alphaproteobacteria bacterium]
MAALQSRNILIVEDDQEFRHTLAEQLRLHEEFDVEEAGTGEAAIADAEKTNFNAILLDVGLPDMDGRDVCRVLRRKGIHAPVIMLTGMDSDADTVLGLDSGANDYVTKPFRMGVLLARLRAHIRQHEMSEDASFAVGPYLFRPAAKILRRTDGSKDVSLSEKENAILKHLYRAGDAAVSCEKLYAEIWDHSASLMTHTLQTHVYRLRQKIEDNPSDPRILVSEHGGYRLVR